MNTSLFRHVARITGLLALVLGIITWVNASHSLVPLHILLGGALFLAIMVLAYQAFRAGVSNWMVALAVLWGIGLPVWGIFQESIFPSAQWLTQVLHLLCGVGAIGIAEMLAAKIKKLA